MEHIKDNVLDTDALTSSSSKSDEGSSCSPENEVLKSFTSDKNQLLKMAPEEIWLEIFKRADVHTLEMSSNSSPYFRKLLLPQRVIFLFPSVWKILAVKYETDDDDAYDEAAKPTEDGWVTDEDYNSDDDTCSEEYEIVSKSSLSSKSGNERCPWFHGVLNLRLVCKMWRDGVNAFYQNLPHYYEMEHDEVVARATEDAEFDELNFFDDFIHFGEWAECTTMLDVTDIENFVAHFEKTHCAPDLGEPKNPFLTRKLSLEYGHRQNDFHDQLVGLLQKFGRCIWFCDITSYDVFPTKSVFYFKFQQLLGLMPNLRVLDVQYGQRYASQKNDISKEELEQLEVDMRLNPFPVLQHLRFIKSRGLPGHILNKLISKNPHVSMLEINQVGLNDNVIFPIQMPNLTQLSMNIFSNQDFMNFKNPQINWPLTKLYLNFEKCAFMNWSEIFSLLQEKWANTLTNVALNLPKAEKPKEEKIILQQCPSFRLNLPGVRRLKLTMSNFSSLDFILPMKDSLGKLDISLRCNLEMLGKGTDANDIENRQLVQFLGYFGQTRRQEMESNIWILFAKLKQIKVVCTYDSVTGRVWRLGNGMTEFYRGATRKDWLKHLQENKQEN